MNKIKRTVILLCVLGMLLPAGLSAQNTQNIRNDIGYDRAVEIALAEAGGGTVVDSELDRRNGRYYYEIEVFYDGKHHEFEIGADDGVVLQHKIGLRRHPQQLGVRTAEVGKADAEAIALKQTGGGTVTRAKLDRDDGILIYEIRISHGDFRYEIEIDAITGAVVSYEKELRYRR